MKDVIWKIRRNRKKQSEIEGAVLNRSSGLPFAFRFSRSLSEW
ncbi:hypothetical protein CLOSTHATH_05363 [Hungatella hathewayi DSM 13479]|uniref:Uncharacterized protein n=1 Tax=Hungatella hathewayi DSM 13479 TaxID=566550 RepID=D3AP11_9FIRM|nr:hypothetical protein CLOSTHATH_05363 [Hungatella hathewayi DSM 13479]